MYPDNVTPRIPAPLLYSGRAPYLSEPEPEMSYGWILARMVIIIVSGIAAVAGLVKLAAWMLQ